MIFAGNDLEKLQNNVNLGFGVFPFEDFLCSDVENETAGGRNRRK